MVDYDTIDVLTHVSVGHLWQLWLKAVNQTEVCSYVSHFAVGSFRGVQSLMADDRNTGRTWQNFAMPFNISVQNPLMVTCAHFPLARASHSGEFLRSMGWRSIIYLVKLWHNTENRRKNYEQIIHSSTLPFCRVSTEEKRRVGKEGRNK